MTDIARRIHADPLAAVPRPLRRPAGTLIVPADRQRDPVPVSVHESPSDAPVPVLRPRLPDAQALLPYLQRIDASRTYSNWGPLVTEFGERLCDRFDVGRGGVVLANSGMSALMGGIMAVAGRASGTRPLAIVPDFTFTATGLAAVQCGYQPALASCDAQTWTFSPDDLLARPALLERTGVVVPVAPFGRPVAQEPWLRFQQRTGVPVVIDAAACFESLLEPPRPALGVLPIALSFHATKSFGTGEGGAVVTSDLRLAERVFQALNFGFLGGRNSELSGFNGKMSEYAAAVGLAELDAWEQKRRSILAVCGMYRHAAAGLRIDGRLVTHPEISSSYVLLRCDSAEHARQVVAGLAATRIDTRQWYGAGLHHHDVFRECARLDIHEEDKLIAATLVGLPMAPDLTSSQVERVCQAIRANL